MSKCTTCTDIKVELSQTMDRNTRRSLMEERLKHLTEQRYYYNIIFKLSGQCKLRKYQDIRILFMIISCYDVINCEIWISWSDSFLGRITKCDPIFIHRFVFQIVIDLTSSLWEFFWTSTRYFNCRTKKTNETEFPDEVNFLCIWAPIWQKGPLGILAVFV